MSASTINRATNSMKRTTNYPIKMIIIIGVLCTFIFSCSGIKGALNIVGIGSTNSISTISVESLMNSNLDTPVALDILFIRDEDVTPLLMGLNGPEWFLKKAELTKRFDQQVDIVSLEVVPLSLIKKLVLPKKSKKANRVLLFTNYRSIDGQYIADLSHFSQLNIRLLRDSYELIEMGDK